MIRRLILLFALLALSIPAGAHLGSPDTFVQRNAGPYSLLISLHPPAIYPGALELDLRSNPGDHLTSATATLDTAVPTTVQLFADGTAIATLWEASPTAHKLHLAVQGSRGPATLDLDLPAITLPAPPPAATHHGPLVLLAIALFAASIVILRNNRSHSRGARSLRGLLTLELLLASCVILCWAFLRPSPHPVHTTLAATLAPTGTLDLVLTNPSETFTDLAPDHGKLLHLFLIRQPGNDVFLHLHPTQLSAGHFTVQLPAMPPGAYQLFADFYHADARGETATLALDLPPQFHAMTADPDDSSAVLPSARSNNDTSSDQQAHLPDGYTLQLHTDAALQPLRAHILQVTLLDPAGNPPADMALYLGMPAHAVVLGTKVIPRGNNPFVFAHIHPGGTLPMLTPVSQNGMDMPGMDGSTPIPAPTNTAALPYGFPGPGEYRLFVQMKHGHIVETAAFDLHVGNR